MSNEKVRVAIVGLGFGAEFIPIYQSYPGVEIAAICRRNKKALDECGERWKIKSRYTDFNKLLEDPNVDAIHINSPIPDHGPQSIAALKAGKHVACTVPMATSIDECRQIVETQRKIGKVYMMMETVVYSREFLFVKELVDSGELGRVQFMRGAHQQEMTGSPGYWEGLPPMYYATHCVSPCLALVGIDAANVVCHGSGKISDKLADRYGSPFAVETATLKLRDSNLAAEVTRSLFETARQYRESFDVYGDKLSFEWQQIDGEDPIIHRGEKPERVKVPDFAHLLPEPIRCFTTKEEQPSFVQGGHGGSHPHLVHAFVSAIKGEKPALPDAATSANWTMVGICAHYSAMNDGEKTHIPRF